MLGNYKYIILLFTILLMQMPMPIQSKEKLTILPKNLSENITSSEAYKIINDNSDNPNLIILDVRTLDEFHQGHIKNAINLDVKSNDFTDKLKAFNKNKVYLVYCKSENRAKKALNIMKKLNFIKVYSFGGIIQWEKEGYPVVK